MARARFLGLALIASAVRAQAPPSTYPAPAGANSVEVVSPHAPILSAPRRGATRRGTLAFRARFAFVGRVPGDGCTSGAYVDLGERRFVCEEYVAYSPDAPFAHVEPRVPPGERLPLRYAFIRFDATPGYARPADYFTGDFVETYGEGFGLVITRQSVEDGIGFVRTRRGTWVTDDSVRFAQGSDFEGVRLEADQPLRLAWTRARDVRVYARPGGRVLRRTGRRERVEVEAIEGRYARLVGGGFIRSTDLNLASQTEPPAGAEGQRWIDVDVSEQVLVAYEGAQPVFATLVSTGRDTPGSRTPLGTFHVWAKLATSDMDDLERDDVRENYLIEGVPWVQYFDGSVALHAAFWHDDFGRARSHGCVNLAPADARALYAFTAPDVPEGLEALIPFTDEARTIVRVHE